MATEPSEALNYERRLVALAVLKANWDMEQHSYIDSFVPFAMEAAYRTGTSTVRISDLRRLTSEQLGFALPDAALRIVLQRAGHRDLGKVVGGHDWVFDPNALARFDSTHLRAELGREQRALIASLQEFARTHHAVELSYAEAEAALVAHISAVGSDVLLQASGRHEFAPAEAGFVAASFIARVLEKEPTMAAYLERLVVGSMLAAAVREGGLEVVANPFRELTVFLDTPILIDLLGRSGDAPRDSARESVKLLSRAGARIACFEHTVTEVRSIFHGLSDTMRDGFRRGQPPAYGTIEEYVISHKLNSSDLISIAEGVAANLGRLGIETVTPPPHSTGLVTIDEATAEEVLVEEVHPNRPNPTSAARFDLDSLTATYRVRGGRVATLEDARAIFVARNRALVRAARRIYPPSTVGTPIAFHSSDLVTIAWLKCPRELPDLPKLRLAADAFAAARPSRVLIERYTEVLLDLRGRGTISEAELYDLRYATEAHKILMSKTHGDESKVDQPTVIEILEDTRRIVYETADTAARIELTGVREELAGERKAREDAEALAKLREDDIDSATRTIRTLRLAIGGILVLGDAVATFFLWRWLHGAGRHAVILVAALLAAAGVTATVAGRGRAGALLGFVALVAGLLDAIRNLLSG